MEYWKPFCEDVGGRTGEADKDELAQERVIQRLNDVMGRKCGFPRRERVGKKNKHRTTTVCNPR